MTPPARESATIVEVAPRDGLQNEPRLVATEDKIRLVDLLSDCGYGRIEVTSFVSPRWVPQMADAPAVMTGILRRAGTRYAALTPNMRGFEAALAARADEVAVFASASESFSEKNINCSIAESIERFRSVAEASRRHGVPLRGYVSCVVECPYEGAIAPAAVARVTRLLAELGCYEISLGDTIGSGTPESVDRMLTTVRGEVDAKALAGHFHDTSGRALENIGVALEHGLRVFDASAGGLGGCPFAPGAAGNVDSLEVRAFLETRGFNTGLDLEKLDRAGAFARSLRSTA
ncbi:hydroxymethylglutaryl-CoA lyase (plasmid) [Sinorhizobium medicae]|uniref:hydroxymethylglutaryl-CoA lyase n=1 Tax=Sinorhizobium medicae TaxID=110321 RepID=UPI00037728CA|nr:hydroxymethylglutaryl-CoA lyase [Sinorhizobium medicae]WQO49333.1 hydroxymethylglutaryl-CoA lyase [Sinorhizobium medicae]WQO69403.1 hydroxymethylglutaryl-CoA lyase [Sinorhizobium medicae]WQO76536.1 hydroxymethylglutaryl-CoA lyase [Sinorhizobium medicae]WQO95707.1 hydroxymethylglutaryl-CoA lyase [Sinorhizobium medicae]